MIDMKLSPPWQTYYHKLEAFFGKDPEITMDFNDADKTVTMFVRNNKKADALTKLLPSVINFGNVDVCINIVPENQNKTTAQLLKDAFEGNDVLVDVIEGDTMYGPQGFVVFKNEVVQYFNDNMFDPWGLCSTLYQDIAKDVLSVGHDIHFCTARKETVSDVDMR